MTRTIGVLEAAETPLRDDGSVTRFFNIRMHCPVVTQTSGYSKRRCYPSRCSQLLPVINIGVLDGKGGTGEYPSLQRLLACVPRWWVSIVQVATCAKIYQIPRCT